MTAVTLSALPRLEALSPLVFRILGCNPGTYELQGTNTYLVGAGPERILIDTGGEKKSAEYVGALKEALTKLSCSIQSIVITHWHGDHVGGIRRIVNDLLDGRAIDVFKYPASRENDAKVQLPEGMCYSFIGDNHKFQTDGATLRVMFTPGHTTDHIALLLEEERAIFSGDCILGEGTTIFEDLYTYMKSLQIIQKAKPSIIYPGHGPVIRNPVERLKFYISHRKQREQQILDALDKIYDPITPMAIVDMVYQALPKANRQAAANNVVQHLEKLVRDGIVVKTDDAQWILRSKF